MKTFEGVDEPMSIKIGDKIVFGDYVDDYRIDPVGRRIKFSGHNGADHMMRNFWIKLGWDKLIIYYGPHTNVIKKIKQAEQGNSDVQVNRGKIFN
jgi:hypothetical protein